MKTICATATLAIFLTASILVLSAPAATLLSVDFGRNLGNNPGTPSPVQAGFNGMAANFPLGPNIPPPSLTAVFGSYTVTVTGDPYQSTDYTRVGFEDTAASASGIDPSIRSLYEDAMINNLDLGDGSGLNLSIQGVTPNTQYQLKLWSYNSENTIYPTPTQFGPRSASNTTGTTGSVTQFALPLPTSLNDYSTTILVSSTSSTLDIHAAGFVSFGGTRMNGFELSSLVPEPSGVLLGAIGFVFAAAGCRRTAPRHA